MPDLSDLLDDLVGPPGAIDPAAIRDRVRRRRQHRRIARAGAVIAVIAILGAAALVVSALGDDEMSTVTAGGDNSTTGPSTLLPDRDFTVLEMSEAGEHDQIGKLRSAVTQAELDALWNAVGFGGEVPVIDGSIVVSIPIADDACPPTLTRFDRTGDVLTPVFREPDGGCEEPLIPKTYVVALRDAEWLRPSFTLRLPARERFNDERRLLVTVPPSTTSAVTPGDRSVAEMLVAFADRPDPETFAAIPFAERVALGAGDRLLETRGRVALAEPSQWVLDIEGMWGRTGTTSALDLLATDHSTVVRVGPHPHCASPPTSPPPEVDGRRRVSITPTDAGSCLDWFSVDLYLDADGLIVAVTVDLWEP